ncbi:MAG: hypothetical protein CMB29_04505 [Euryarchaeota archaeon]|nr:hypothetical protein [Euryarchaeota archaeon]DAC30724.1 MAG TPA: hypothetical protein D7H81_02450 [Candidatus Poseidoniales archaeon]HII44879.1 hypothetical protein [Candidatus Poseidoniaceae archaeon]|tara:strand:- start:607 stop:1305 length:699 start_codon:yes stop_codon:yes gene_type:complete
MPRLAFDKASLLIFSGDDRYRFIDGLSSNKIDFSTQEIINTLVLTTKAKIMAQLHLFMLNDMLISITISENNDELMSYFNSKILTQKVTINDVSNLNYIDLVYDEDHNSATVSNEDGFTSVKVNSLYSFEIYSKKHKRLPLSLDYQSFIDWRVAKLIPWHGYEITSKVNPYQCGLNSQVHESKGCYTGQEVLTRMRSRNNGMRELFVIANEEVDNQKITTKGTKQSLAIRRV